jgi:peptidyl-prolyl cis-trans isomerase C
MMTFQSMRNWLIAAACTAVVLAAPAGAQQAKTGETPKKDTVVVRVNGYNITAREVQLAMEEIAAQLVDVPPKMRYPLIVEYLIERHLLAQKALKDGLQNSEEYKRRVRYYQYKALRDAYFFDKIAPKVTEAEIRKVYEQEAKKVKPVERVRARHILVSTREEAEKVLKELKAGAKFEDLARKYSKDGSKEFGGDLGYFTYEEMVPEFSKAVFALKVGEVSKPVKTDYGWHIIKLEDRKKVGMAPFESVKEGIRSLLLRRKVQEEVARLSKNAKIEFLDPELKKMNEEARKRIQQMKAQGSQNQPKNKP